jgi:membrane protease YdiL (CAAX protease family)
LISSVMTFIIPALGYAFLCDNRPFALLGLKRNIKIPILLLVIVLLVAAQPFAIYMGQLNEKVNFGQIQMELQRLEKLYENAMTNFIRMDNGVDLLINLLIVAILPAVGEELFFRGSLQSILERWTGTPWIAIFLSSFVFAILHGTFFKFLGIFTLGAVLGTLFYITRNLWYNLLFHFLNNTMALLAAYYASRNNMLKKLAEDEYSISLVVALVSLAVTIGIFILIKRNGPPQRLAAGSNPSAQFDIE